MDHADAKKAAQQVIDYWAKLGFRVHAYVVPEFFGDVHVQTMTIRSDLVNGMPPGADPRAVMKAMDMRGLL